MTIKKKLPEDKFFMPKGPVCESMCARCPFKPDGTGYATRHPDFPFIVDKAQKGLPFFCHETVILDERTTMLDDEPDPPLQDHFRLCRGATLYKQGKLELNDSVVKFWNRQTKK